MVKNKLLVVHNPLSKGGSTIGKRGRPSTSKPSQMMRLVSPGTVKVIDKIYEEDIKQAT
jgi:hypothetical protein